VFVGCESVTYRLYSRHRADTDIKLIKPKFKTAFLTSHSARASGESPRGEQLTKRSAAPRPSQQHAFCIERSHHSAADNAATDGNAVKIEKSCDLRTFPFVAARAAAVDGCPERKI